MVKLTNALVARKMTKKSGQRTDNDTDALRKLTHLHLQDSFIDTIVSTLDLLVIIHSFTLHTMAMSCCYTCIYESSSISRWIFRSAKI
jgi:hypothetical protein